MKSTNAPLDEPESLSLAHTLAGWIDPLDIHRAARAWTASDVDCLTPVTATLPLGKNLEHPDEVAGACDLVSAVLPQISLDVKQLRLMSELIPEPWEEGALKWLSSLRFEGSIESTEDSLQILERSGIQLILRSPLEFLLRLIDQKLGFWKGRLKELREKIARTMPRAHAGDLPLPPIYHNHRAPEPLAVVVERWAFHASGAAEYALGSSPKCCFNYRSFTIVGKPPFPPKLARQIQDVAKRSASKSLLGPKSVPTDAVALPPQAEPVTTVARHRGVVTSMNARPLRNQVSPFWGVKSVETSPEDLWVDTYYGHSYDFEPPADGALYGALSRLPDYPEDGMANRGYLRVPFRKIPRIAVTRRSELELALGNLRRQNPNASILYRGQTAEFSLKRTATELKSLYGSPHVLEPSLLASLERRSVPYHEIVAEWHSLLRVFLEQHRAELVKHLDQSGMDEYDRDAKSVLSSYDLYFLGMALAQHYGLASVGLDVTTELDIALFLALTEFFPSEAPRQRRTQRRPRDGPPSVLYVFGIEDDTNLDYEQFRTRHLPTVRPDRQSAHFLFSGWGFRRNDAATRLLVAFLLDPAGDWGTLPSTAGLFPSTDDDQFARFLSNVPEDCGTEMFRRFMGDFYTVEEPA